MGTMSKAFEYLAKAEAIHIDTDPNRISRTSAIFAMSYLRAGRPDQALEALRQCWKLQGLSEEQVAISRYPKHSGDIVLLARIYYAQGGTEAALQLALKTITIRKGILGNKGPRVADSMFLVACILQDGGKESLAAKLLREVIDMSQGMMEMQGHLARALWTLGTMEEKTGETSEAERLKQSAREVRRRIEGRETDDEDTEDSFSKLVGYMLW